MGVDLGQRTRPDCTEFQGEHGTLLYQAAGAGGDQAPLTNLR